MKRIAVCADGTWNRADQRFATNVVKTARAILPNAPDGKSQVVFYHEGVGNGNFLDRLTGGAFGGGLEKNVKDCYHFLMYNYAEGDEIYLFGFSRGAYTVRSLAGLIRKCGLLKKENADKFDEAYRFYRGSVHPRSDEAAAFREAFSRDVEIYFLGVWDTVGALGIPVQGLQRLTEGRYKFHDVELSGHVRHGYHALAIDEQRRPFKPSLWNQEVKPGQVVEQVWFAGAHTDVGGGNADSALSDSAFLWMKRKAQECGMAFDEAYLKQVAHPDPGGYLHDSLTLWYRLLAPFIRCLGKDGLNQAIHRGVVGRYETPELQYHPQNVADYLSDPGHRVEEG